MSSRINSIRYSQFRVPPPQPASPVSTNRFGSAVEIPAEWGHSSDIAWSPRLGIDPSDANSAVCLQGAIPASGISPAGQDLRAPSAPETGVSTAPIAAQRQSFLDNLIAQIEGTLAWNDSSASSLCRAEHPEKQLKTALLQKRYSLFRANNPQRSWGFDGEPPEAVMKDSGTKMRLYEEASFSCSWSNCLSAIS